MAVAASCEPKKVCRDMGWGRQYQRKHATSLSKAAPKQTMLALSDMPRVVLRIERGPQSSRRADPSPFPGRPPGTCNPRIRRELCNLLELDYNLRT